MNDSKSRLPQYLFLVCAIIPVVSLFFFFKGPISAVIIRNCGLITGWDGSHYYFWLRSLLFDGDVDFRNELLFFNYLPIDIRNNLLSQPLTTSGLLPNKYPVGWALLFSPAMLLGGIFARGLKAFGSSYPLDGYSLPYQLGLTVMHFVYVFLSITFLYRLLSLKTEKRSIAILATLLAWAGSPLYFYQTADVAMAHNATFFCLISLFYICEKTRITENPSSKHFFLIGLLSGLAIVCRPQAVVYLLYPAIIIGQQITNGKFKNVSASSLLFFAVLSIQLICNWLLYGQPFTYTYQGETFDFLAPKIAAVLFSPFHGAFYWHPILLLGTIGFIFSLRKHHDLFRRCLLASVACNLFINASWYCWWFGASFGQRALEGLTILASFGLSELLQLESKILRHTLCAAITCLVFWNINLTALAMRGALPFDRPVEISEMATITKTFWFTQIAP